MAGPSPPPGTSSSSSHRGRNDDKEAADQFPAEAAVAHDVSAQNSDSVVVPPSQQPPTDGRSRQGHSRGTQGQSSPRKRASATGAGSAGTSPMNTKVATRTPSQERPSNWTPPGPAPDFDPTKVYRFKDAPPFPTDKKHNPGEWNNFVFRPTFKGRSDPFDPFALPAGATPALFNEETKQFEARYATFCYTLARRKRGTKWVI